MMNMSVRRSPRSRSSSTGSSDSEINSEAIKEAIHQELRNEQIEDEQFQPLGSDFDFEQLMREHKEVIRSLLCHNEEVDSLLARCEATRTRSFLHAFARAQILFFLATNLDKACLEEAFAAYKYAIDYANAIRKRSWVNHLGLTNVPFLRPNYNKYTDEECMAELMYGFGHGPAATLNFFLKGKTSTALLSSSWYGNRCYRSYWECEYILKHRTEWQDDLVKANFEATLRYVRGCMDLGMSYAPKFIRKFMQLFGYMTHADSNGMEDIEAAAKLKDGIVHPLAVITIFGLKAVAEPFLGSGNEGNFDRLGEVLEAFSEETYGGLNQLILGAVETLQGNIESSIEYQRQAFPTLRRIGKTYLVCYSVNMLNHSLLCQWEMALKFLNTTKKERKLTKLYSSGINYLHACHLQMIREDKEGRGVVDMELDEVIKARLRDASEFKGVFILKRIKELFVVPMVVSRAKRFLGDLDSFVSPLYEVLYLLNCFTLMDGKPHLLGPFLERTLVRLNAVSNSWPSKAQESNMEESKIQESKIQESKIQESNTKGSKIQGSKTKGYYSRQGSNIEASDSDNYWNKYAYLLFFKAIFLKHLGRVKEASNCFREIISIESSISYYKELVPQSLYELGLICRRANDVQEAQRWLMMADERRGYATRELMKHRINTVLESLKQMEPEIQ